MSDAEKARLEELRTKKDRSPEEETELASLEEKAKAGEAAAAGDAPKPGKMKGGEAAAPPAPAFDKEGATSVVTIRDSKAVTVWFRDGKEIGTEDV